MTPDNTVLKNKIEMKGLVVYDGVVRDRYRFHFDLLLDGNVLAEYRQNFTQAIQEEWNGQRIN